MSNVNFGLLREFNPQEEEIDAYLLRMKHFFKVNNITNHSKKVSILITVIRPQVLRTLSDLVFPNENDSKDYDELVQRGLIRLRRLPFGLSSSPALFQAAIDQILSGIPGTAAYLDDVLIGASSRDEGLRRLESVLQRLAEYGVKVNGPKCKFLQSSIEYLGHVISAEGLRPQESTLSALKDAPEPINKDELRAYLGLINYYHSFIPNLSARLSCLYDLLHKNTVWNRSNECSIVFQDSKSWVLNSSLLVHYDVNKPIVLTCDASPRGVAAVLSHLIDGQERPVAFASKTLSSSERNYSKLHREALALIFGVTKFHKYLYGRKNIVLQTDHQPLAAIFGSKKGVPSLAAARLQRWALILSSYNLEVRYRKAADVPHADALSRLPLPDSEPIELEANYVSHLDHCVDVLCCLVSDSPFITSKDVEKCTDTDPVLSKVRDFVMNGWTQVTDPELTAFYRKRYELSVDKNCVLWGARVVIPKKLQPVVLDMLHEQHPGITRMKMLARSYVWWPGLDQSIEDTVNACQVCQYTRNAESRIPLQQWPMTSNRWQRLHIDYAEEPNTREQLLIVLDSFSKWLEVFVKKSANSVNTIARLRSLFSSFGLPEEVVTDNGTCFTSYDFKEFLQKNGVKHTLTPPYHAESNGAAERCVQIVKKNLTRQVLEEHLQSQKIPLQHKVDNFLFSYRNTPTTATGMTPAELFLTWKPRIKLTLLKPNLMKKMDEKKNQQKEVSDRRRGNIRTFMEGQKVFVKTVRNEKVSLIPGKIIIQRSPATYLVSVFGKTRFCHADHLRSNVLPEEEAGSVTRETSPFPSPYQEPPPTSTAIR